MKLLQSDETFEEYTIQVSVLIILTTFRSLAMAGDIANICQQLGAAVELTMNPSVPMEQRHQVSVV